MAPGNEDDLPDRETFHTDFPLPQEVGCTSSSGEDDDDDGANGPKCKRPRLNKPWCELLFPKVRIDTTPSVKQGMTPSRELEFRRYLADTILTLVQKLSLSLDTFSVAVLFMHRFLMYRPVQIVDKRKLALACVFLASKTNEDRRPPIMTFVCTFYRLCCRRELNPSTDHSVYQRLYQELLFWESQILLVLGFNMHYRLREVRREIDGFCEEQVHIPRQILRCALCVFVLNTLALTTLPLRWSYRVIYLVSISLTLAWAGMTEPRVVGCGTVWWQFLCMPNSPSVEEFEAMKAEMLHVFESTNTKFHDYFASRQNSSNNASGHNSSSTPSRPPRATSSAHHTPQGGSSDAEGLTGMPIIPSSHHNGVAASQVHERVQPDISNAHQYNHSHSHHHRSHGVHDAMDSTDHQARGRGDPSSSAIAPSSVAPGHKHHHKHHHRDRSERPVDPSVGASGDRRSKERRSGAERQHRRRSRSSHRRESNEGRGEGFTSIAADGAAVDTAAAYPWDQQQQQHESSKYLSLSRMKLSSYKSSVAKK